MLSVTRHFKLELKSTLTQFVRFVQIFPRKPRPPHFAAQRIALTVKPVFPKQFDKDFPQHLKCRKLLKSLSKRTEEENPYERILANEIKDQVLKSKMLLIIHKNPMTRHFLRQYTNAFKKEKMTLMSDSRTTFSMALCDTKYAPILGLFRSYTLLLSSPEVDVHKAYSLLKKMPPFTVLAGVIEDKFVDRNTLDEFGKLPDLDAARMQLAHTLNTPAMILAHNITLFSESLKSDEN